MICFSCPTMCSQSTSQHLWQFVSRGCPSGWTTSPPQPGWPWSCQNILTESVNRFSGNSMGNRMFRMGKYDKNHTRISFQYNRGNAAFDNPSLLEAWLLKWVLHMQRCTYTPIQTTLNFVNFAIVCHKKTFLAPYITDFLVLNQEFCWPRTIKKP